MRARKLTGAVLGIVAILAASSGAVMASAPPLADTQELEAFLDGLFAAHMEVSDTPGATVSVVYDGALLFSKGYGFADAEARTPVRADTSLFRIGSISKIFAATAVMQMVEQGKLQLDKDVNEYLTEFKVPDAFGAPVTLTHLLTHTAGFEEARPATTIVESYDFMAPLGELLARGLPERVRPPGTLSAYSNHGQTLSMYLVEIVSGTPYDQYIERHILQPLGMRHTTTRQPIPERLANDLTAGHIHAHGDYRKGAFEIVPIAPAGVVSSSADDMARFMITHLQYGRFGDVRVLEEATARRMQARLFEHDPRVGGMAHQFFDYTHNGERVVSHGGNTQRHHSMMLLMPEHGIGFFTSINGGSGAVPTSIARQFVDHYFPAQAFDPPGPIDGVEERLEKIAGSYRSTRRGFTHIGKVFGMFDAVRAAAGGEGKLIFAKRTWVETEPYVFHELFGPERLVFRTNEAGLVTQGFVDTNPHHALEKIGWSDTPAFHVGVLVSILLVLGSALIAWSIAGVRLVIGKNRQVAETALSGPIRLLAFARVSVVIVTLLLLYIIGAAALQLEAVFYGAPDGHLRFVLNLGYVIVLLALAAAFFAIAAWRKGYWTVGSRIRYSVAALACVLCVWWLDYWNLLGARF